MIGIDLVEIERVKNIYQRHGLLFLEKILDAGEISDLPKERNRYFFKRVSCLVASKEAIFKACSEENLDWKEISIRNINKVPQVCIRRSDFKQRIKLSFAINSDVVLAQALMLSKHSRRN